MIFNFCSLIQKRFLYPSAIQINRDQLESPLAIAFQIGVDYINKNLLDSFGIQCPSEYDETSDLSQQGST